MYMQKANQMLFEHALYRLSFSPAIFGAQRLNPRGGHNTGMFPVGYFLFSARMDTANEEI